MEKREENLNLFFIQFTLWVLDISYGLPVSVFVHRSESHARWEESHASTMYSNVQLGQESMKKKSCKKRATSCYGLYSRYQNLLTCEEFLYVKLKWWTVGLNLSETTSKCR